MVGIVIVAHSARLADALLALTKQMLRQEVPLTAAGGIDDPENPFGTDVMRIHKAIESVYSSDGVVVLMDMGSALLSSEMALEFLTAEQRAGVRLCEAPLVEGAIAAAVRSEGGGSLEEVLGEALGALKSKASQLHAEIAGVSVNTTLDTGTPAGISDIKAGKARETDNGAEEIHLTVNNRLGIHARPAARFVTTAAAFQSLITVRNITGGTGPVNARSINLIATLGVRPGHEIAITAIGPDAPEALAVLKKLVENGFGEAGMDPEALPGGRAGLKTDFSGIKVDCIPASPGIAIGPAVLYRPGVPEVREAKADDPEVEWKRLQSSISAVQHELRTMRGRMTVKAGDYEAAIFDALLLSLEDPVLIEESWRRIFEQENSAGAAWQNVIDGMVDSYSGIDDSYLRLRGADLGDLKNQVLRVLGGSAPVSFELSGPSVLVCTDLSPSEIVRLDTDRLTGICAALGSANSHGAILARSLGIPAVAGAGAEVLRLEEGTRLVLDGGEGKLWINPDDIEVFRKRRKDWLSSREALRKASLKPAVTSDGRHIEILANIGSAAEVMPALRQGAEGVGVLRTEFLFLDRAAPPSEEEQCEAYRNIAGQLEGRSLIIRTLDAGGDKPLPYLDMQVEANPFLGQRGIRLCLASPAILKTQLRAILRASPGHRIKIMFPMISSVEEVQLAREFLREAQVQLRNSGISFDESVEVGIMVEVPSAAITADFMAGKVDFFSIGTNDLSQYIMAADRTNAVVSTLRDELHPAVLRMIRQTVTAGHAGQIRVGVCGEMAGDKLAVPVLLGLGVDELSMNPTAIPDVKQTISRISMAEAEKTADAVLNLDSAEEVRKYVLGRHFR